MWCFKGFSQSLPQAPQKVEFANVTINLNAESRQKINDEITRLLTPKNDYLNQKLERIHLYFPVIEKIFEVENVPEDFKYLAVLESSLLPDAVSPTNATGFWQFKDFTAAEMGLIMNGIQDERKNLQLSTKAAAKYLKKNNLIFKNWLSTALSFHVGAGAAAQYVPVEWSFANDVKLSDNPHQYFIKAIANKIAFENAANEFIGTKRILAEYPARGKSFEQIAAETNVDVNEIKRFNNWVKGGNTIPTDKEYLVLVPTADGNLNFVSSKIDELSSTEFITTGYPKLVRETQVITSIEQPIFYTINNKKGILAQSGDDIASLARKGDVSISKFLKYNDLSDRDLAQKDLVYYLQKKNKRAEVPFHTLQQNQNLWDVSQAYGVRLKKLKKYNRIKNGEDVLPNRVIWLNKKRPRKTPIQYNASPVAPPEVFNPEKIEEGDLDVAVKNPGSTTSFNTHRVLENETLFSIANKYGTSVDELRRLNNLGPNEGIKINQRLIVPTQDDEPRDNWLEDEETSKPEEKEVVLMPEKTAKPATSYPSNDYPSNSSSGNVHYVQQGETLFSIAKQYDTTVDELRRINGMSDYDVLQSGQKLNVRGGGVVRSGGGLSTSHTVQKGETLYSISKNYGTTVEDLKEINNLSSNEIFVGQNLLINGSSSYSSSRQTSLHTVRTKETIFSISQQYGMTPDELRALNNLDGNLILIGQKLRVNK